MCLVTADRSKAPNTCGHIHLGLSGRIHVLHFWLLDREQRSRLLRIYFFAHPYGGMYNLDIIKIQEIFKEVFYLCGFFRLTQLLPVMDNSKCHLIRNMMS